MYRQTLHLPPLVVVLAIRRGVQLLGRLGTWPALAVTAGIPVVGGHVAIDDLDHVTSGVTMRRAIRREYDIAGRAVHTSRAVEADRTAPEGQDESRPDRRQR